MRSCTAPASPRPGRWIRCARRSGGPSTTRWGWCCARRCAWEESPSLWTRTVGRGDSPWPSTGATGSPAPATAPPYARDAWVAGRRSGAPPVSTDDSCVPAVHMINADRLTRLLADLVRHNSINPDLVSGAPGEGAIAAFLYEYCRRAGLEAEISEVAPGRANVIARLRGRGGQPALLFDGHIDTVGVDGMTIDPFDPVVRDGRLYGRGAFDMKGGVAAMVEAAVAAAAQGPPPGDVVLAMVADEEYASLGTQAVVRDVPAGAAILTPPPRPHPPGPAHPARP